MFNGAHLTQVVSTAAFALGLEKSKEEKAVIWYLHAWEEFQKPG